LIYLSAVPVTVILKQEIYNTNISGGNNAVGFGAQVVNNPDATAV